MNLNENKKKDNKYEEGIQKSRTWKKNKQWEAGAWRKLKGAKWKFSTNHVLLVFVMPDEDEPQDVRRNRKTSPDTLLRKDPKER